MLLGFLYEVGEGQASCPPASLAHQHILIDRVH